MREELKYKTLKESMTLKECRFRCKVNALCRTDTIKDAAIQLKVSVKHMHDFMKETKIKKEDVVVMRTVYQTKN